MPVLQDSECFSLQCFPSPCNLKSIINILTSKTLHGSNFLPNHPVKRYLCSFLKSLPVSELDLHIIPSLRPHTSTWKALLPCFQLLNFGLKEQLFFEAVPRAQSYQTPLRVGPMKLCAGWQVYEIRFLKISFKRGLKRLSAKIFGDMSIFPTRFKEKDCLLLIPILNRIYSRKGLVTSLNVNNVYSHEWPGLTLPNWHSVISEIVEKVIMLNETRVI